MATEIDVESFKAWAAKQGINLCESQGGLKVGDTVTYTNEYGVSFENLTIIGIADESYDFYGRKFFLAKTAWWFPIHINELQKQAA